MAYLGLNPEAYVFKVQELQDISSQFNGVATNFALRTTNNDIVTVNSSMQLNVSLNGVYQQPNTASSVSGPGSFWIQGDRIYFSEAPAAGDVFFGQVNNSVVNNMDRSEIFSETFTADGVTTDFTMSKAPPNIHAILVTIDGLVQHKASYTLISQNLIIRFDEAPNIGSNIEVTHIGFSSSLVGPTSAVSSFYGRSGAVELLQTDDINVRDIDCYGAIGVGNFSPSFKIDIDGASSTSNCLRVKAQTLPTITLESSDTGGKTRLIQNGNDFHIFADDPGGTTTDILVATQGYITTENSIGSLSNRTTVNIASNSTGVTQSLNTNNTTIATTAFVRQEVADLIGSAPAALDTLQELSTALGDDPNFATTINNSISLKADASSGTLETPTLNNASINGVNIQVNPNGTVPHRIRLGNVIFPATQVADIGYNLVVASSNIDGTVNMEFSDRNEMRDIWLFS